MMLQNDLSIQRATGPDRQIIPSVWFDGAGPVLFFSQKVSSSNSNMRLGNSVCRSKSIIRNGYSAAQNLKERLSGFFQFFTAQPVNIPVLLPFNLGILLICYRGPIRILTVFDFAKFRQHTQQWISIGIPFRVAETIQHHRCNRLHFCTFCIVFPVLAYKAGKHPRPRPGNVPKNRAHSGLRTPWPCQYGDNIPGLHLLIPAVSTPFANVQHGGMGTVGVINFQQVTLPVQIFRDFFQRLRRLDAQDAAPVVVAVLSFFLRGFRIRSQALSLKGKDLRTNPDVFRRAPCRRRNPLSFSYEEEDSKGRKEPFLLFVSF